MLIFFYPLNEQKSKIQPNCSIELLRIQMTFREYPFGRKSIQMTFREYPFGRKSISVAMRFD